MKKDEIIIIRKKKSKHHPAHHGGAWKIAYADFVTSMMAFFLLLWLLSAVSDEKLKSLSEYFSPSVGAGGQFGNGVDKKESAEAEGSQDSNNNSSTPFIVPGTQTKDGSIKSIDSAEESSNNRDTLNFSSLEKDLYKAVKNNKELKNSLQHVIIDQIPEGLRIQLIDDDKRKMFKTGSPEILDNLKILLVVVAKYLKYMPNYLSIDGHTSVQEANNTWELSAQRAEIVRQFLVNGLVDSMQIYRITGKGEMEPLKDIDPKSHINERVSLILLKNNITPYAKRSLPENIDLN
jgi:chemotaxis protein MotB